MLILILVYKFYFMLSKRFTDLMAAKEIQYSYLMFRFNSLVKYTLAFVFSAFFSMCVC